jgi:uncharacterized protein YggE
MFSRKYLGHLVAALSLGGIGLVPAHAAADEGGARTAIIAHGSGEVHVEPDSFHIDVGIAAEASKLDAAKSQASAVMQRVIDALQALDVPDLTIETRQIRFTPVYAPPKEGAPPSIVAYSADNRVLVTAKNAPPGQLGPRSAQIIDAALDAGANEVGGVDFFLADPSQAEDEALTLAVQSAETDAQTIAKAANVTLTGVVAIEESSASHVVRSLMLEAAAVSASTPIEVGDITISSNVTARFSFR